MTKGGERLVSGSKVEGICPRLTRRRLRKYSLVQQGGIELFGGATDLAAAKGSGDADPTPTHDAAARCDSQVRSDAMSNGVSSHQLPPVTNH